MKAMLQLLFLAALMLPLAACGGGESEEATNADTVAEQVNEATEAAADQAEAGAEKAAEKICCGGGCDAPAGFCCSDGTCGGNHDKLPIEP